MKAKEIEALKARLQAERERILKELGYLESRFLRNAPRDASGDLSGYSYHLADSGTDTDEREKAAQLTTAEGRLLAAIDSAIERIDRGAYGICSSCGESIGAKRLEAMPYATQCIECKEREERAERTGG